MEKDGLPGQEGVIPAESDESTVGGADEGNADACKEQAKVVGHGVGIYLPGLRDTKVAEFGQYNYLSRDLNPQEIFEKFALGEDFFIVCDLDSDDVCVGRLKEIVKGFDEEHVNTFSLLRSYRLWYR